MKRISTTIMLAAALFAVAAYGAPRDRAANEKIEQAINQHYLAAEFDQAESLLLGTVRACADQCSPGVMARAWMYVGVIRGSAGEDQKGAMGAFRKALSIDPTVTLDSTLATPATKETFSRSGSTADSAAAAPPGATETSGTAMTEPSAVSHASAPPVPADASMVAKPARAVSAQTGIVSPVDRTKEKSGRRVWLGLHVAGDIAIVGGKDVCSPDNRGKGYSCFTYNTKTLYRNAPFPGVGDTISHGVVYGTTRLLASADYAMSSNATLGIRVGYVLGGGPKAWDGTSFLPVHAEGRLTYWIVSLDRSFRPYVHVGGGLAQVDAKSTVDVLDCAVENSSEASYEACRSGSSRPPSTSIRKLDVYRRTGEGFATLGGGLLVGSDSVGLQFNVNVMVMFPVVGYTVQPSIGVVFGI